MPFNKGDFTQQGVAGHVNANLRLNEKRLVSIDLTSNEEAEGCTITGTVKDLLNDKVYNIGSGGGGGDDLIVGVIRPDAELVEKWTYNKLFVDEEGGTIPAYSTSKQTLKTLSAPSPSVNVDIDNYDYFIVSKVLATPIYSSDTKGAGRVEYMIQPIVNEYINISGADFHIGEVSLSDNVFTNNINNSIIGYLLYWVDDSNLAVATNSNYGPTVAIANGTFSDGVYTPGAPTLHLRGNATYFTSTYWSLMTDIRYQIVTEMYKVAKGSLNIDGYNITSITKYILDCVNNNEGILE